MALIVEDGSIVSGANTYLSLADAQTEIDNLGYSVTLIDANILRAMALLNTMDFCGVRTDPASQALPFPRSGIVLSDDRTLASDTIPAELKTALAVLSAEINAGNDPTAATGNGSIKREEVDVIKIEYQQAKKNEKSILDFPLVKENLKYLVCSYSGSGYTSRIGRA